MLSSIVFASRYAMVTGIAGSAANTQTLYIVDDVHEILFAFEYHSRANRLTLKAVADIQLYAQGLVKKRAERQRGERNR